MKKTKILIIALATIIVTGFFFTKEAFAQSVASGDRKIVVSGTADQSGNLSVDLYGNPGEELSGVTTVTNLSKDVLKIKTEFQDFIVESENGIPTMVEQGSSVWSMSTWISVASDLQEFNLEPNETKDVNFTVKIPTDATPGGHYTMILFTPAIVTEDVVGPLIENKVGNLVKLTVSGDIEESAEIVKFEAPYFSEYGPIPLKMEVLNDGNTHVSVQGNVIIKNTIGKEVASWDIQSGNVFPTAVRLWETEWQGKWRFGIYKAEAVLTYGSEGKEITAEVFFWIIPWKVVLVVVAVIIFLIILGYKKDKDVKVVKKEKTTKAKPSIKNKLESSKNEAEV